MRRGKVGDQRFRVIGSAYASFLLLVSIAAYSADPQPYKVKLADTRDSTLNDALQSTSELLSLRKSAPVGPFGLIGRAQNDIGRLKTVLESVGFYQGTVSVQIDSLALDDPRLGEELTNKPAKQEADVQVSFNLGPQYHLGRIELTGDVPPTAAQSLHLTTGAPAVAADVLAAADRVRQTLADGGYAYAKVDPPHAKENSSERVLNVSIRVAPGGRYRLGDIHLTGLKTINESYVRKRLLIHAGDEYKASAIEAARRDLLAVGVFTQVTVELGSKPDPEDRVPLTFRFRERKAHVVSLSGAYSSDLGVSAGVDWLKHEITGNADSLDLSAKMIDLGGTASNGVGYDLNGRYTLPDWKTRDQSLQVQLGALRQSLDAYDQTAVTTGVSVIRKLSSIWSVSAGFSAEREQIVQEAPPDPVESAALGCTANVVKPKADTTVPRCTYHYTLLGLPLSATYNTTGQGNPLADAIKGVRANLLLTPTFSLGRPSARFLVTQLTASAYFDLKNLGLAHDPGRSVLALRALGGLAAGASQFSLPPDQRFYAGGSGTIRGYRYQSVGPLFQPDGNPIGGTAINAGTVEYRQRIGAALGFAAFVDAGNVSQNLDPLGGDLKVGVGAGVRYYTPLGPLRVDFAVPLQRRSGKDVANPDDAFEVYIGLGQAF